MATCRGIVEKVAELRGQWLDVLDRLLVLGIAFQHEDLMFRPALLLRAVDGIEEGAHGDADGGRNRR